MASLMSPSSFKRAFPPRRLPSRGVKSKSKSRPKVPTHRGRSSETIKEISSPHSTRFQLPDYSYYYSPHTFSASSMQNGNNNNSNYYKNQQEESQLEGRNNIRRGDEINMELFNENENSPLPHRPQGMKSKKSPQNNNLSTKSYSEKNRSPPRHFYLVSQNNDYRNISPVKLIGYSIYNSLILNAIVDVTPCQWRLEKDPFFDPVELHIRQIDLNDYPMRRLLRLIQKSLPYYNSDNKNNNNNLNLAKGSLYIHKKDNQKLSFINGIPNIIPLKGATVFADILDIDLLSSEEDTIYLRWIEHSPGKVILNADISSTLLSHENITESIPPAPPTPIPSPNSSPIAVKRSLLSYQIIKSPNQEFNNNNISRLSKNGYNRMHDDFQYKDNKIKENEMNFSNSKNNENIPPITYLHTPSILY